MEAQRQLDEPELRGLDPVRADLRLTEPDLPGSRQANTSKKPPSVPPFAALRRSKASTAQAGAPASASVLAAGAGNHSERSSRRPKEFTHTPCQPWFRRWCTMASSAHDRLPLTANLGLRDQIFARPGGSSPSHGSSAHRWAAMWTGSSLPGRSNRAGGRSVISMAPQSWPGALSGASKIVNAPLPMLRKANVVCEECHAAKECGATARADGHCWTAADLTASLALRRPPTTARRLRAAITFGAVVRCSG